MRKIMVIITFFLLIPHAILTAESDFFVGNPGLGNHGYFSSNSFNTKTVEATDAENLLRITDNNGQTFATCAVTCGVNSSDFWERLIKKGGIALDDLEPLRAAVYYAHSEIVQILLQHMKLTNDEINKLILDTLKNKNSVKEGLMTVSLSRNTKTVMLAYDSIVEALRNKLSN